MNTKAEQPKGTTAADIGKLVLAAVILVGGIVAYSWFSNDARVPPVARLLGVLAALVVSLAIAAFTALGRRVRHFVATETVQGRLVRREVSARTPGCAHRFTLAGTRRGRVVAVKVTDTWGIGGIHASPVLPLPSVVERSRYDSANWGTNFSPVEALASSQISASTA